MRSGTDIESFRQKVAFYLEDIETPIGRTINLLITTLVLLSSVIFVAETYPIPEYISLNFRTIDLTILILFAYEYDVTPISEPGRLLTVMMILTGIALIPTQLANLIKQFLKTTNQVTTICPICGFSPHDIDAIFCKMCGASLDKSKK